MVERYSENVSREIAREYLEGIERIKDTEYRKIVGSALLRAAADHLNNLGHEYSAIETEEGERLQLKQEYNEEEGDILTLKGLKELADI
jgi:hypothetical protein